MSKTTGRVTTDEQERATGWADKTKRPEFCSSCGGKKGWEKEEGGCLQNARCDKED